MINAPAIFGLLLTIAYIVGSISFAWMVARLNGVDLQTVGSGNFGATNVYRAMGIKAALIVFILDALKAGGVTWWTMALFASPIIHILVGVTVIFGHTFSLFLGFKGGKGVAPAIGMLFALIPVPMAMTAVVGISVLVVFRMVSLASLCGAVTIPIACYVFGESTTVIYGVSMISVSVIVTHRSNIQRLIAGCEHKI